MGFVVSLAIIALLLFLLWRCLPAEKPAQKSARRPSEAVVNVVNGWAPGYAVRQVGTPQANVPRQTRVSTTEGTAFVEQREAKREEIALERRDYTTSLLPVESFPWPTYEAPSFHTHQHDSHHHHCHVDTNGHHHVDHAPCHDSYSYDHGCSYDSGSCSSDW